MPDFQPTEKNTILIPLAINKSYKDLVKILMITHGGIKTKQKYEQHLLMLAFQTMDNDLMLLVLPYAHLLLIHLLF